MVAWYKRTYLTLDEERSGFLYPCGVVYLSHVDNCDRPLPSRLPGVNQNRVSAQGCRACFASSWTHLPHPVL